MAASTAAITKVAPGKFVQAAAIAATTRAEQVRSPVAVSTAAITKAELGASVSAVGINGNESSFFAHEKGDILDDYLHPNQKRYPEQRIMVIGINNYAYLVPYVEDA